MPVIDPTSPVVGESSSEYWKNELINTRILLYKLNLAIDALTTGGHQSYELDTGQDRQRVTRMDLGDLMNQRNDLLSQIHDLEIKCGVNGHGTTIVRPAF